MKEAAGGPQAPGRTPRGREAPQRCPGAEDTPPEASEAPAREASVASAPGYNPRRTLPLRVEAIRQLRRRRTMVAALILLALPWILVGAFELGGPPETGGSAPGLVDLATIGGLNFAAFSFFASVGFLLVVAVALFCGDTVASEAGWGTLRYLLAAPVPRARLLRQKLVVALAYSAVAVTSFPLMSLLAGTVAFGWHPLRLPGTGAVLGSGVAVGRMGIVLAYVLITELVVAGLAFLLSVSTDSPLGAVGGAVGLVIVSDILDAVTALGGWRRVLPSHWQFAWLDAMQPQISWGGMLEGAAISLSYALILFAWAFRHFRAKDIVS
jgi:ABC-type transport system involved in multi-copper enzyme maturation permease subunit